MTDLSPRQPKRPLLWSDIVLELQEHLEDYPSPIYIVGGAVRDAYLHRPLKDIDLVTPDNALALARKIANRLQGDFFALDAERGVGRALIMTPQGRLTVDVAQFRGADLLADLTDRDFTANAMAVDLHGDVNYLIDPLNGERDLEHRLLRRCAPHSLAHDAIRTLRAVRQSVQLGLRIEADTLRDIRLYAPNLAQTSPERVRDELFNLLALVKAGTALRIVDMSSLLDYVIPDYALLAALRAANPEIWTLKLNTIERLIEVFAVINPNRTDNTAASFGLGMIAIQLDRYRSRLIEHLDTHWANDRPHRALAVLAVLLHGLARIEDALEGLRLSNAERQRLTALMKNALPDEELTPLVLHRFWRRAGAAGIDFCLLALAQHLTQAGTQLNQAEWLNLIERVRQLLEAYFDHYSEIVEPPVLVNGEQLMRALDLKPGPFIGRLLEAIREAQVTRQVQSVEDALQFARGYQA